MGSKKEVCEAFKSNDSELAFSARRIGNSKERTQRKLSVQIKGTERSQKKNKTPKLPGKYLIF